MKLKKVLVVGLILLLGISMSVMARGAQNTASSGITLRMIANWNGLYRTPSDQINNPVAVALREKTGVTVVIEGIMMNEMEHLNLMFASGDMPDIVNAPFWGGGGGETGVIKRAASQGRLLPIQNMLDKYPNIKRSYDIGVISQVYLERELRAPEFNGNLYLIPQETGGSVPNITNWAYGAFVRGDVPRTLGVDVTQIKTSQQLFDFMVRVRDHGFRDVNGNPTIVATTFHDGWDYGRYAEGFSRQARTDYIPLPDGSVTHYWLTPEYVTRNLFVWRMVNQNLLDRESFRHNDDQANTKVGNGTALFYAAQYGPGINATKLTGLYTAHPEMRYIPIGPLNDINGRPLVQREDMGRTGSPVIFFPTTNRHLEETFRYIDYINTIEGMTLAEYGIEGRTFVRNAQGQPRLTPDLLRRKAAGDSSWEDEMREVGARYLANRLWYGSLRMEWFGETEPGNADAAVQELEDYKLLRPVQQFPGYSISAFEGEYPQIDAVRNMSFSGTRERDWRERAYFANTEAEARQILLDWQNYLRTAEGGIFMRYLDFIAEKGRSRNDIAW